MIGVSQLSKYEAAALYPDETSDIVETVAVGLWLVHVLQVYTSCMVSLVVPSRFPKSILTTVSLFLFVVFVLSSRLLSLFGIGSRVYQVDILIPLNKTSALRVSPISAELERVWRREWSLVKFLYLWNRYYGLLCFSLNLWLFNGDFTVNACKSL